MVVLLELILQNLLDNDWTASGWLSSWDES
jgi:hypothetical protein